MLELRSVTRSAGRETIFQQASLTFAQEKPTVLLGLSPAGRKAALRIIGGADRPEAGAILVNGVARQRGKDAARFAWIGREGMAPYSRSVGKVLRAAAGKPGDGDLARLAARLGLAGKLDARTRDLDLDGRVRLAIGCAIAARHPLMLLDAPFQDLPAEARTSLLADVPDMLASAGAVVVLAAASADEARALGGQTVILAGGRVVQAGPAAEVFAHPRDLRAALATAHPFLNTLAATLTATPTGDVCRLADGSTFHAPATLRLPPAGRCTLAFRPEDLGFERQNDHAVRFAVRADGEETVAGRRFVRVKFADAIWFAPHSDRATSPGMVLNLFVDVDRVLAFDDAGLAVGG